MLCHKSANGPPKREREREKLHYSIKNKAHIHKGKGGGTQREDECPKSIKSKVKTTPQKREGRKGTKRMDRWWTQHKMFGVFCFGKTLVFLCKQSTMTLQESFVVGGKAGKCSICAKLYDAFKVEKSSWKKFKCMMIKVEVLVPKVCKFFFRLPIHSPHFSNLCMQIVSTCKS